MKATTSSFVSRRARAAIPEDAALAASIGRLRSGASAPHARRNGKVHRILLGLIVVGALFLSHFAAPLIYAQQTERAKNLGKRLMCMCGCNQILTACNHVGCTTSATMLKNLDQFVARNEPDDLTIQAFVQEYGEKVLAEPPARGFNWLAWLIPMFASVVGLGIVLLVLSHWRRRIASTPGATNVPPELLARARRQADQETED